MRKTRLLGILLIVIGLIILVNPSYLERYDYEDRSFAYSENNILAGYNFKQPVVSISDDNIEVMIEGLSNFEEVGKPVLPFKEARVLIPFQKKVKEYRLNYGDGRIIAFGDPVLSEYPSPTSSIEGEVYLIEGSYINEDIEPPEYIRNEFLNIGVYNVLSVLIYPVEYIEGNFYFYENATLEIILEDDVSSVVEESEFVSYRDFVKNSVDNPDTIDSYKIKPSRFRLMSFISSSEENKFEYIIITSEELKNSKEKYNFTTLLDKKKERGITGKIVTTKEIYSNESFWCNGAWGDEAGNPSCFLNYEVNHTGFAIFNDSAAMIRNYIKYAYNELGTKYILLGGDTEIIPVRSIAVHLSRSDRWGGWTHIESDIYYSNLNGSFNENNNSLWGDGNETDWDNEVIVGRAPVQNETELSNFVRKTLLYLNNSNNSSTYLKNVFLDYDSSVSSLSSTGKKLNKFDITREPWAKSGNTSIINYLNSNYNNHRLFPQTINIAGHGSSSSSGGFRSDNVHLLNNAYMPFFVNSQSCFPGSFSGGGNNNQNHSVFEKILVIENGSFAVISNTHNGWIGPSDVLMENFWKIVVNDSNLSIGESLFLAKSDTTPWQSYSRWLYVTANLMGDPEISLFTEPEKIKNISITLDIDSPIDGWTYNYSEILLNFSMSPAGTIQWFNGSENISYKDSVNKNFSEGINKIIVYGNNSVNETKKEIRFYIDTTPPSITDSTPKAGNRGKDIVLNFSIEDNSTILNATLETNINGSSVNYTYTRAFEEDHNYISFNLTIGGEENSFNYTLHVIDLVGNYNSTNGTVTIENTPPIFNNSKKEIVVGSFVNYTINLSELFYDVDPNDKVNVIIVNYENISIYNSTEPINISADEIGKTTGRLEVSANDSKNTTSANITFYFYTPNITLPEGTNFSVNGKELNVSEILDSYSNIHLVISKEGFGNISFSSVDLLEKNISFEGNINISDKFVEINSSNLSFLQDKPATILIKNISNLTNPTIHKNGNPSACMECNISEINREKNHIIFKVSGFSNYSITEANCKDGVKNCHDGFCEEGVDCGSGCKDKSCLTPPGDSNGGSSGGSISIIKSDEEDMNEEDSYEVDEQEDTDETQDSEISKIEEDNNLYNILIIIVLISIIILVLYNKRTRKREEVYIEKCCLYRSEMKFLGKIKYGLFRVYLFLFKWRRVEKLN